MKGVYLVEHKERKNYEVAQYCCARDIQPWLSDTIGHNKDRWRFPGKGQALDAATFERKYKIICQFVPDYDLKQIIDELERVRDDIIR